MRAIKARPIHVKNKHCRVCGKGFTKGEPMWANDCGSFWHKDCLVRY